MTRPASSALPLLTTATVAAVVPVAARPRRRTTTTTAVIPAPTAAAVPAAAVPAVVAAAAAGPPRQAGPPCPGLYATPRDEDGNPGKNLALSPAFTPGTTSYTLDVPYTTATLDIAPGLTSGTAAVGVRRDHGDPGQGAGVESGAGLAWQGDRLSLSARTRLFRTALDTEWGIGAALDYRHPRGTFVTLSPSYGNARGQRRATLERRTAPGQRPVPGRRPAPGRRVRAGHATQTAQGRPPRRLHLAGPAPVRAVRAVRPRRGCNAGRPCAWVRTGPPPAG